MISVGYRSYLFTDGCPQDPTIQWIPDRYCNFRVADLLIPYEREVHLWRLKAAQLNKRNDVLGFTPLANHCGASHQLKRIVLQTSRLLMPHQRRNSASIRSERKIFNIDW